MQTLTIDSDQESLTTLEILLYKILNIFDLHPLKIHIKRHITAIQRNNCVISP